MMDTPLVSSTWLSENLNHPNLVILDASMKKVTSKDMSEALDVISIPNARFFDIKGIFSNQNSDLPNTFPTSESFEASVRELGISIDSMIVVYDNLGIYSSPRAWWMFKAMGHHNVAILDGGLVDWVNGGFKTVFQSAYVGSTGDFVASFNVEMIRNWQYVLNKINDKRVLILDARSKNRFDGTSPEPRNNVRSGHIPNSVSLSFNQLLLNGKMLPKIQLVKIFNDLNLDVSRSIVFSCGSGITACILALGAEIAGLDNLSIYDGSWTEWGSMKQLPIDTNEV